MYSMQISQMCFYFLYPDVCFFVRCTTFPVIISVVLPALDRVVLGVHV